MEKSKLSSSSEILKKYNFVDRLSQRSEHISKEYQDYGIRLSYKLNDPIHKALYIKLAKEIPRNVLDAVSQFSLDYPEKENNGNRGKIFMWKLKLICAEKKILIPGVKRKINKKKLAQKKQIKLF
jgi:hypothetical protein